MELKIEMNKRKKVLHFLKTGNFSGAENVAITIICEMRERYNYEGVYVSLSGDIDNILRRNNMEHAVIVSNSVKEYQRIIDLYQPDIIHAHDFGTSVIVSRIKSNAVKISHLHNNPPWLKTINIKSLAYLVASRKFKHILTVSDSVLNEYIFGNFIRKKTKVVNNPVDISKIIRLANIADEYERSDVLFLGRLSAPKNPSGFLEIVSLCKKSIDDISTLMIGKGELEDEIKNKISQLNLEKNVKLLGFKNNPYGYLKHTKVLCVPSNWEGFGLVVVEALALGIPIVASPVGGMKNLVTEEIGKLCNSNYEFEHEIIQLLNDEQYYARKSEAAYNRAQKLDNKEQYIEKIYSYYNVI